MNTTKKVGLKGSTDQNTLGRHIKKGPYLDFEFLPNNIRMFINRQENKNDKKFPEPDFIISRFDLL